MFNSTAGQKADELNMSLNAVPNPNNGEAALFYSLGKATEGTIFVRDLHGRLIERIEVSASKEKVTVDYSRLPGGIYFISLYNHSQEVMHQKMVISR